MIWEVRQSGVKLVYAARLGRTNKKTQGQKIGKTIPPNKKRAIHPQKKERITQNNFF